MELTAFTKPESNLQVSAKSNLELHNMLVLLFCALSDQTKQFKLAHPSQSTR